MSVIDVLKVEKKKWTIRRAKGYVTGDLATVWGLSGQLQLDLLKRNGITPSAKVLEVGCGCLNAGVPIIRFLEPGNYVGIEPNKWLVDAIRQDDEIEALILERKSKFLHNFDFDATAAHMLFDFVISHSILSHAAHAQLSQFLERLRPVLKPDAKIVASIKMSGRKGNLFKDSQDTKWVYPVGRTERIARRLLGLKAPRGVSRFSWETVQSVAAANGFNVVWEKEYREYFTKYSPFESHDWVVFTLRK